MTSYYRLTNLLRVKGNLSIKELSPLNRFQKTVEFAAYQFNPSQITSAFGEGSVKHLVTEALGFPPYDAVVIGDVLHLTLLIGGKDNKRELFLLREGEWVAEEGYGEYYAYKDAEFREFASSVR